DEAYFYPIDFDVHKDDEQYKVFFKTNENEHVYFYLTLDDEFKTRDGYITVNDDDRFNYFNNFTVKAKYIGKFNNQEVILDLHPDEDLNNFDDSQIFIYGLDVEKYKNVMNKLKENSYIVEKHGKENLVGQVTLKEGQRLFTSIPYENGWTIKVDGEKVKYTDYNDTFMVIDIPAGTHTVEMKYISPGFKLGVLLTILFLCMTIFYENKNKLLNTNK
ncbi:MAG: YfhO family protein, partial [Clostridia bacterium]|nr:YfhO family protein [Clostridia bacterium]